MSIESALRGQTLLVTGATGFVGSHLAERLAADGARVRGLARSAAKAKALAGRGIEAVEGDLTDADSLRRAAAGCSIVFSVAGWLGAPRSAQAARRVNVEGTRALAEAAIGAGARRIVHTSSIAAYGIVERGDVDETWPLRAVDAYGSTKARSESIVMACADRIEVSVIRPAQVFGPRGHAWTLQWLDAVRHGLPILAGSGSGTFHPCYIDNLVDAYLLAAAHPAAAGEAFTIVDGTTTWREFMRHYAHMAGRPARSVPTWLVSLGLRLVGLWAALRREPPLVPPGALKFLTGQCRYRNDKAKRLLGWSPRVSLDEGMRRTEVWLRESGRL